MRDHLRRCLVGAFALVSIGLPATALASPEISRADGDCAPGWGWSVELNQCVFLLPAANGPGGRADPVADPEGPAPRGIPARTDTVTQLRQRHPGPAK